MFSFSDLHQLIKNERFDELIGLPEGEHLDAKEQPYQLSKGNIQARRELAKDISSFANANGGFIIVGFSTTQDPVHPTEQITGKKPFPRSLINADQYYKLINEWIYPQPVGVTITIHEQGPDPDHVLAIIAIPRQDPTIKPFLITKTVDETKITDITVGYVERRRDTTKSMTVVELHHALRLGLNLERELLGRLEYIQRTIDEHFQTQTLVEDTKSADHALKLRVGMIGGHETVKDTPRLVFSATPIGHTSLRTILSSGPQSVRRALADPPSIRSQGWGLATGDTPEFVNGRYLEVDGGRQVIHLYRDGTFLVAARIDGNFLAWSDQTGRRLHPLALIEVLTNCAIFYRTVLDDLQQVSAKLLFVLDLQRLHRDEKSVWLPAGGVSRNYVPAGPRRDAPANDWYFDLIVESENYDPERVAFLFLRELYGWFGHTEEDMPYIEGTGEERRISIDAIQAVG